MRNMSKRAYGLVLALIALCLLVTQQAQAHHFWVNADQPQDKPLQADIGYGHDFPNPEPIAEDRVSLFAPLRLISAEGTAELAQKGENYSYTGTKALPKGSYLITGTYLPTVWSKGPDGWQMKNKKDRPDATFAEEASMFAKTILNVGDSQDDSLISKPVGARLEIVPLKNPATVRVGETFPVQVLLDGEPLKMAEVKATFAGFSENKEHNAFQGRGDLKGRIDIVTLKEGYWFISTEHKYTPEDTSLFDEVVLEATLTAYIGK